jgi:DMSO/TMAO reductase YedYZ molybdopterin-dependent catalytic subunit
MRLSRLLVVLFCLAGSALIAGMTSCGLPSTTFSTQTPNSSPSREVEATEYLGLPLTPIVLQQTTALKGVQVIDKAAYRLVVDGLVEQPLNLSYQDLLAYPQVSKYTELDCVDGWNFAAKVSGPELNAIFNDARVKPEAVIAIFHTVDVPEGYTSLELSYLRENHIMLAFKLNDITLPAERGFPFQMVAENKFGYKWAKWVTQIELSDNTRFRGYWESHNYNNDASINGPRLDPEVLP